jgi:hypothetical protein
MRLQKKSLSRVALIDLLRRKKTNLERFLNETGIVTYELLLTRCASMGAVPPSEAEFLQAKGNPVMHEVSSPTEGIVVLLPPPEVEASAKRSDLQDVSGAAPRSSDDAQQKTKKKSRTSSDE